MKISESKFILFYSSKQQHFQIKQIMNTKKTAPDIFFRHLYYVLTDESCQYNVNNNRWVSRRVSRVGVGGGGGGVRGSVLYTAVFPRKPPLNKDCL